jgi:spore maturation protein CgeB
VLILYVAPQYDYGQPEQGHSFEHHNFYHSLVHLGHNILYFDFLSLLHRHGQGNMNRRLQEVARAEKPDLMFTVLFAEELDRAAVREISDSGVTLTLNWFCDDHWRFEDFSRHWAPCFNWVVTTAQSALPKYAALGYTHVIKSQWACNHFLYRKLDLPLAHEVTFVGQPHGQRRAVIQALRQAGLHVDVWGQGWEAGRLTQEEMIRVFNQSRINLNLSNASSAGQPPGIVNAVTRRRLSRWLDNVPFGPRLKQWRRQIRAATDSVAVYPDQIKGRNFEIPGCGGFTLTGQAENLEDYYVIGQEVVTFDGLPNLVEKIRYYLGHEAERAAIVEAGYQRTRRDHTYARRFADIFQHMGLPNNMTTHGRLSPGRTEMVG